MKRSFAILTLNVLFLACCALHAQKTTFVIGPTVNFNPNTGLNKLLKDFNDKTNTQTPFNIRSYSFGVSGSIESKWESGSAARTLSWFNFHYESSRNEAFWEDSVYSLDYSYYRAFTSFGVLNGTWFVNNFYIRFEPLCFGRHKMRLKRTQTDKAYGVTNPTEQHKAIWNPTLIPSWTPGIGFGKEMKFLRLGVMARCVVPRTLSELSDLLYLNNDNYSNRVGYFSLSFELLLKIGG